MRKAFFVLAVILGLTLAAQAQSASGSSTTPKESGNSNAASSSNTTQPATSGDKGCLAVKSVGSHAFRNIMLGGVAGALVSKEQYEVMAAANYPAKIGQKFHGNDLQTIQNGGTKVVILEKDAKADDAAKACPAQ